MLLRHLVEELYDVREVHVPVQNDIPIVLDQGQGHKEKKVAWTDLAARPNGFPNQKYFVVGELPLKIQQEPSEVSKICKYIINNCFKLLSFGPEAVSLRYNGKVVNFVSRYL